MGQEPQKIVQFSPDHIEFGSWDNSVVFDIERGAPHQYLKVRLDDKDVVTIAADGSVKLGEGVTADAAALAFWAAVERMWPGAKAE